MKKPIFFAVFCIFINSYFAQAQKLVENKNDEFTGQLIKRTGYMAIDNFGSTVPCLIRFSRLDTLFTMDLSLFYIIGASQENGYIDTITRDSKLLIKTDDSKIITMYALKTYILVHETTISGTKVKAMYPSFYSKEDPKFTLLATYQPVLIRISAASGTADIEVKKPLRKKWMKAISLLR